MPRVALFLARFCTSAWIGAATLFVIVGILEVTSPRLESSAKDILVSIRFPAFYAVGASLVAVAWLGCCAADFHPELSPRRRAAAILALLGVMVLMVIDYNGIYLPLTRLIDPPGQPRSPQFGSYHQASKNINFAGLALTLVAAVALNLPRRPPASRNA